MPEKELTIAELWSLVSAGMEKRRQKELRLQKAESRILRLRQLLPEGFQIPKPTEFPGFLKALREALWGEKV